MSALKVTLVRSPIGYEESQKKTVRALGLTRMHQSVERPDNAQVRGMVESIRHLVAIEPIEGELVSKPARARRRGRG
ncbi:MAG: 50S ribosomal protein L30 [Armatimonadetes bacterium]|nr:50S ribosomal protein L30 [Armatimonadota bacterium]